MRDCSCIALQEASSTGCHIVGILLVAKFAQSTCCQCALCALCQSAVCTCCHICKVCMLLMCILHGSAMRCVRSALAAYMRLSTARYCTVCEHCAHQYYLQYALVAHYPAGKTLCTSDILPFVIVDRSIHACVLFDLVNGKE